MCFFFCYRWLYLLLSRINYQAMAFVMNASRDRQMVVKKIGEVRRRLNSIERKQSEVVADLDRYLQDRMNMAKQWLSGFLSSDEVKARFTSWSLDEVPDVERSWEATENQIMKALSSRLREIIEQWEEDNQVFATAREALVRRFKQRCSQSLKGNCGIFKMLLQLTMLMSQKLIFSIQASL